MSPTHRKIHASVLRSFRKRKSRGCPINEEETLDPRDDRKTSSWLLNVKNWVQSAPTRKINIKSCQFVTSHKNFFFGLSQYEKPTSVARHYLCKLSSRAPKQLIRLNFDLVFQLSCGLIVEGERKHEGDSTRIWRYYFQSWIKRFDSRKKQNTILTRVTKVKRSGEKKNPEDMTLPTLSLELTTVPVTFLAVPPK